MMEYSEAEQKIIDRVQSRLKKFKISYYYLDFGMEGIARVTPTKIIEAETKEMAVYIYQLMFFASSTLDKIENIETTGLMDYATISYKSFLLKDVSDTHWGIIVEDVV